MESSNIQVAKRLRELAAAYTIKKGNLFRIRAYENAADTVEHSTSEVGDLWEEGKLDQLPGIGASLKGHLEELFVTGKVKHWEEIKQDIPGVVFEILGVPGIGSKTALKLANLGVTSIKDLKEKIQSGKLVKVGFSEKIASKIFAAIEESASVTSGRMLLPYAFAQAERIIEYLQKSPAVSRADSLGSLRRMVATVGDLDFSIASQESDKVVEHIVNMPGISRVVEKGKTQVSVVLFFDIRLDFLITEEQCYGALLQHLTGSKQHNIHLRVVAEHKGLSLSEYGVKNLKSGKIYPTKTEEEFYTLLGMETPPPEIREDTGEIEIASEHQLPKLISLEEIKSDLHLHSNFPLEPSHGSGLNSLEEIVGRAQKLGYSYIGISDHPPSASGHNCQQKVNLISQRSKAIEQLNYSSKNIRVLNLLEVDILPDGSLSVPEEGLKKLDFVIAGIHSSHRQTKEEMTKRILTALDSPFVKVLVHPTGRLLNERESYEVDWEEIFKFAAKHQKALEINAYPNRLDLPDVLVRSALDYGVKFIIGTDSHEVSQMSNMRFGVAVARRGWVEAKEIINTWDLQSVLKWFKLR